MVILATVKALDHSFSAIQRSARRALRTPSATAWGKATVTSGHGVFVRQLA